MPWSDTSPMDQKTQFIVDYLRGTLSVAELCESYGISRKTGYKWIERYLSEGPSGLCERPRRPGSSPNETPAKVVDAIIEARGHHPSWGAKKLLTILRKKHPRWLWPHRSTVCDILKRNGLVPKKRRRRASGHPGKPDSTIAGPNDVWCADYKGQFKTGNGIYCFPLTVTDAPNSVSARLPGATKYLRGRCKARLHTPFQRVRSPKTDPHRQWRPVRH